MKHNSYNIQKQNYTLTYVTLIFQEYATNTVPVAIDTGSVPRKWQLMIFRGSSIGVGKAASEIRKHMYAKLKVCSRYGYYQLLLLLHPFNSLFSRTTWVSRYKKGKTSLELNKAKDDGALRCSGISWTICKRSVPYSRQITTSTPHHSIFTGRVLFLMPSQQCQSTEGQLQVLPKSKNAKKLRWGGGTKH